MNTNTLPPLIEFRKVAKHFGQCQANANVSFVVTEGTIHGIVGENGAGKSTAMKMLFGMYPPTSGEIYISGKPIQFRSPKDAVNNGIGMVHQHFMLADTETVLDNIILGTEFLDKNNSFLQKLFPIPRSRCENEIQKIMLSSGMRAPLHTPIEKIPVGIRQRVEIIKILYRKAKILILDEPTAVLTPQEIQEFFKTLKNLKATGHTILIISHKLDEIKAIADEVTIFRGGNTIATYATSDISTIALAEAMVGRSIELVKHYHRAPSLNHIILSVKDYSNNPSSEDHIWKLSALNLSVGAGEIVGIAGVEGNGQDALVALLNNPSEFEKQFKPSASSQVFFCDKDVKKLAAMEMRQLGLAVIAPDRHLQAILLQDSMVQNVYLGAHQHKYFRGPFLNQNIAELELNSWINKYDIRPSDPDTKLENLSGGNQQKFVCARELAKNPKLLLAAHPTRGVDIGAIEVIHQNIIEARNQGMAILLISSELDEILSLADRTYVFFEGKITGHFAREKFNKIALGACMGGKMQGDEL